MISDDTFAKACHIALKGYLHNELEADADDEAAGNNRTHIAFRKVWKTVAVAAITLTLLFSTCMGGKCPIPGKSHFVGNRNL